jgi:hypothetical protein
MAIGGEVVQQTAKTKQVIGAGFIAQRWILLAHPAEPAEQMGIAAELRKTTDPRKGGVQVVEEAMGPASVVGDSVAP